jgi:hypothetical protein
MADLRCNPDIPVTCYGRLTCEACKGVKGQGIGGTMACVGIKFSTAVGNNFMVPGREVTDHNER